MNVQKAYADGHSLDDIAAEVDRRQAAAGTPYKSATPPVPRETPQGPGLNILGPGPIGYNMSQQKPATDVPGALATGYESNVGSLLNLPGAVLHGAKEAIVNPTTAAGVPSTWGQRFKEGMTTAGQGVEAMGALANGLPAPTVRQNVSNFLKIPGGVSGALGLNQAQEEAAKAEASEAPPVPQSKSVLANAIGATPGEVVGPEAAQVLTDPTLAYGLGKGLLMGGGKAFDAAKAAADALAASYKAPVVETENLLKDFAQVPDSGHAASLRARITGESGPNPELPGSGYEAPTEAGTKPAGTPATGWDQAAIAKGDLVKGPEGGPAWVPADKDAGSILGMKNPSEEGMAAQEELKAQQALPEGPAKVKPEVAPDPRPAQEKMAEIQNATPEEKATTASTNLDQDIQAASAVSKKGVPNAASLAPEVMRADQQDVLGGLADLDVVAEQSQVVQGPGFLDTGYAENTPIGEAAAILDRMNPQTSTVAGRAAEQLNRASEAVIATQPAYNKMLQSAIDLLKKPNGFMGRFIRDTVAEKRVAQALNGVMAKGAKLEEVGAEEAYKFLSPEEQESFDLVKAINEKIAKLEGRDITGEIRKDYWFRTVDKNDPFAMALADKGILFDRGTGSVVKPTPARASYEFSRDPESQKLNWNYDLYDVMNQRISQGVRKAIMDPIITDILRDVGTRHSAGTLSTFTKDYVEDLMQRVQGRPGTIEQGLDILARPLGDIGHWVNKFIPDARLPILKPITAALERAQYPGAVRAAQQVVSRAFYRAYVGANLGTAMKDFAKTLNAQAALGGKNYGAGLKEFGQMMLSPESRATFDKLGIRGDTEQMFKGLEDLAVNKGLLRAVDKGLFGPHQLVELFDRGVSYYAAMQEGAARFAKAGIKPEPWMLDRYARGMTDMINFKYGPQNINPYLNNPIGKLYYQFSTAPAGQLNFMRRLQQMDSASGATFGIGKAQVSNRLLKLLMLQGLVGYSLKKGLDVDVKDLLSPSGQFKELLGRATGGLTNQVPALASASSMPPPIERLAGALGGTPSGIQSAKDLALGAAHIPALALRKTEALNDELQTGQVLNKKGNVAYNVTPGEAWRKYLSLHPDVQQQYIDRARQYAKQGR